MTGFFLTLLTWNEPGRLAQRAFISCQQAPADGPTQQVQGWIGTRYTTLVRNQPSSFSFFKLTDPKLRDENSSEILKRKQTNKQTKTLREKSLGFSFLTAAASALERVFFSVCLLSLLPCP